VGFTADRLGFSVGRRASRGAAKPDAEDADLLGDGMPAHTRPNLGHAVSLYHVFSLSLRDVELIVAERGMVVTHESIPDVEHGPAVT
jgi:hypothetical protein